MVNPAQLPFKEAIDFQTNKIKLPTSGWTDIWEQQHSKAFVVAGAQSDALLEDLYNAMQDAKQNGGGYADFKERFQEITTRHGWSYNGTPGWRSRIIYSTNITQAYNAGRYTQMQAVKHLRPFWMYRHTSIEHPRLQHKSWDGLILPADDPWFDTHMPQNGWGCNCKIYSLSRTEAATEWGKQGKDGPDTAPEIIWEDRIVGKNGSNPRLATTPQGIDPGFGYNVGKAYHDPLALQPFEGYQEVFEKRGIKWPQNNPLPLPAITKEPADSVLPMDVDPQIAITDFLDVFGASVDRASVFTDNTGVSLVISKALFQDGKGNFKWDLKGKKRERLAYINLMAKSLIDPDEIWYSWVKDNVEEGRWRLKRRYVKLFEIEGKDLVAITIFEHSRLGWGGSTTFVRMRDLEGYLNDKIRNGNLAFRK